VRVSQPGPTERFSVSHELRPLLNGSSVILQNPIDEQVGTSVENLWKGGTNHERLRTTGLGAVFNCVEKLSVKIYTIREINEFRMYSALKKYD